MRFVTDTLLLVVPLLLASKVACQNQYTHDDSFTPGSVLRISKIDAPIACAQRESVVVNGTTPGPVVSLTAGQPNWIRVYNDMSDDNATIASQTFEAMDCTFANLEIALAWLESERCALLGRYSHCKPMAHSCEPRRIKDTKSKE